MLTIGQLARRAAVGVETVRFYERKGLLRRPRKPAAGYRTYPVDDVARILFIRRAATLGFTLREIFELLSLRAAPAQNCRQVREEAQRKLTEINQRIASLQQLRDALALIASTCSGDRSMAECSILTSLSQQSTQQGIEQWNLRSPAMETQPAEPPARRARKRANAVRQRV